MKSKFAESSASSLKKQKTDQFVRSFAHVDGNWPSHVYLSGSYSRLYPIAELCLNHLSTRTLYKDTNLIPIVNPHLSLSKPFVLRHHQIESFVRQLEQAVTIAGRFSVQVFSEYQLLSNESNTRLFVTLPVEDRDSQFKKLIESVDSVLKLFSQPVYYDKPLHHISIASCVNSSGRRHNQRVVQVSESLKLNRRFFPSVESDSDDESEKGTSPLDFESDATETLMANTNDDSTDEDDGNLLDVDDCLGAVLEFTGLECRIGNRLFRYSFPTKTNGSSSSVGFKEIK